MTARSPLWYNSGNLQEMTSGEIVEWQKAAIFVYAQSPTSVLTVNTGSAGNLDAMSDTRKTAGAASTNASAFVAEGSTAEPGTATVAYDRIHQAYTTSGVGQTADTGISYPVYYDGSGNIQAMSLTDFKDTFIEPAIDLLIAGTESNDTGGTYTITTSASAATGYTAVSSTAVFIDTRANTGAYSAAWIRYDAANTSGQKIVYTAATSGGSTRGSGMVDTRLNGNGNYQQLQAGADAYRSQEFPDGSAATITTYNLRIAKGG